MKKAMLAVAGVLASICSVPAQAQIGGELNAAHVMGTDGAELGIGYAIKAGPIRITPVVGALIYKRDDSRYYWDANGGNRRCRDSSNGRYADSYLCSEVSARAYGRLEVTAKLPGRVFIGGGVRLTSLSDEVDARPYGTIAFRLGGKLSLKGNVGDDYYAAGVTLGF